MTLSSNTSNSDMVKIKIQFQDDYYVLKTAGARVTYATLTQLVTTKVNEGRHGVTLAANTVKIRYQDEDGDYVTMNTDADV